MCEPVHDVVESVLLERRSIRTYAPEPIADDVLLRILEAGRQAPSAANRQPWSFVVVRDPERRRALAEACNGQMWLADAAVLLVGVGLPTVSPRWYLVDMGIAMQNMVVTATAFGYGTCWIGAFNEDKVKGLLNIPADLKVVAVTPIGVPGGPQPAARGRREFTDIFRSESYETEMKLG
ncbi:MAG: nitroreductase [Anaerolineae bacterium]|mgnify:FL=1|nr:nitroreductase [Anaerolineae bacterium]